VVTMEQRRTIVGCILSTAGSERCACRWLGFHRSAVRYVPAHRDDIALRARLRELAEAHPRWGAPMLTWKLRQEGVVDNHKRIRRLYRLEGLAVRRRGRKRSEARGRGAGRGPWRHGAQRTLGDGLRARHARGRPRVPGAHAH
jgi:hypothetical protein